MVHGHVSLQSRIADDTDALPYSNAIGADPSMSMLTAYSGIVAKLHVGRVDADDLAYCVIRLHHGQLVDFHASSSLADALSNASTAHQRLRLYVLNLPTGARRLMGVYDGARLTKAPIPAHARRRLWAGLALLPVLVGISVLRRALTDRALSRAHTVLDSLHPSAPTREAASAARGAPSLQTATAV